MADTGNGNYSEMLPFQDRNKQSCSFLNPEKVTLINISEGSPPQGLSETRRALPDLNQNEDYFFNHPESLLGCLIGTVMFIVHGVWGS